MPKGHELEVNDKDVVELSVSTFEVFSDLREKLLKFPEAHPGSVVGYEYVQRQRPYVFDDVWRFQETVPVHRSRFVLQLPLGWEFTALWANHSEQNPQTPSPNQYIWEITDSPAIVMEPDMPPWRAIAGHLNVKYFPRDPAMRLKTTGSWNDIGLWYNDLTASTHASSHQIKQKVAELTAGMSDPVEKMKVLTAFVSGRFDMPRSKLASAGSYPIPHPMSSPINMEIARTKPIC
jgi:hypothetical protein